MLSIPLSALLLVLAATLPSASAEDAVIIRWPSCSICFDGETVGESDSVLAGVATGLVGPSATCAEVQSLAQDGNFSPATCVLLRRQLAEACGCSDGVPVVPTDAPVMAPTEAPVVAPTDAPVVAPTEAPVVAPTDAPVVEPTEAPVVAPTDAPVVAPTDEPTAAPTMAPIPGVTPAPVTGTPTMAPVVTEPPTTAPVGVPTDAPVAVPTDAPVATPTEPPVVEGVPLSLTLDGLTGDLSGEDAEAFQRACEAFLAAQLPDVANLTCTIADTRRVRRRLQDDEEPTTITVIVSGETDLSAEELGEAASAAVNENSDAFVEELTQESATFSDVNSLAAVAVVDEPVTESDGGISPGAIVGIVLAIAVVGGGLAYFVSQQQKGDSNTRDAAPEPISEIGTIMVNPPPPRNFEPPKPPVAASIAVSVASQGGSVIGDGSVTGGTSAAAGGASMEGFSLSAAEDTEGNTAARSAEATSVASNTMSSLRQNMISRTVTVLPGKLGIVVDTTLEGPVVNKVNDDSPLEGILFPGDLIVAVDDIDTRAMSASAIYALMIRTSKKERKLTVLSEDYVENK